MKHVEPSEHAPYITRIDESNLPDAFASPLNTISVVYYGGRLISVNHLYSVEQQRITFYGNIEVTGMPEVGKTRFVEYLYHNKGFYGPWRLISEVDPRISRELSPEFSVIMGMSAIAQQLRIRSDNSYPAKHCLIDRGAIGQLPFLYAFLMTGQLDEYTYNLYSQMLAVNALGITDIVLVAVARDPELCFIEGNSLMTKELLYHLNQGYKILPVLYRQALEECLEKNPVRITAEPTLFIPVEYDGDKSAWQETAYRYLRSADIHD